MAFPSDQRQWTPLHLDLDITSKCSLRCQYCYLGQIAEEQRQDMSRGVCDQVLEYTRRLAFCHEPLQGTRPINWNLFGGEPFCAFHVIEYLVGAVRRAGWPVNVEVFTNGATATPEQIKWCLDHNIAPKRSVGGSPAACEATRPGDYLERYEKETPLWGDWGTMRRVTLVPSNAAYVMDSLRYFYARGYYGGLDFVTDDYADWGDRDIEILKDQLSRLAREFVRQFKLGHVLYNERIQVTGQWLYQQPRRLNLACGAGWGTQGITADGYVVPCHRFLREPRTSPYCGGRLSEILEGAVPLHFGEPLVATIMSASRGEETDECRNCSARLPCQHGCYHLSHVTSGDLKKTPRIRCIIYRHYVELVKWVHGELAGIDPVWYLCIAEKCAPIPEDA